VGVCLPWSDMIGLNHGKCQQPAGALLLADCSACLSSGILHVCPDLPADSLELHLQHPLMRAAVLPCTYRHLSTSD
jgi:hypothetical protein